MKFIKLVLFDIKNGILRNKILYITALTISLVLCFDIANKVKAYNTYEFNERKIFLSFADYFLYFFGGMKEYIPSPTDHFIVPIVWIIVFLPLFFATLNYPYNDIKSWGQQILVRTKGRNLWWLSKCFWNITATIVYHIVIFLIIIILCLVTKADINLTVDVQYLSTFFGINLQDFVSENLALSLHIIAMPLVVSISINIIQMTLSLFIKPIFSFLFVASLMVVSAYIFSSYMIGNYTMLIRSDMIIKNGINYNLGFIIAIVFIVISIIIGLIRFHYYDIINFD